MKIHFIKVISPFLSLFPHYKLPLPKTQGKNPLCIEWSEVMELEENNHIDEAAVWRRVTGASPTPGNAQETFSAPEGLLTAMGQGAGLWHQLSGLYRKTGRSLYARLAQEQKEENRKLKGLYFYLTGTAPKIPLPTTADSKGSLPQQLRQLLGALGQYLDRLEGVKAQTRGKASDTLDGLLLSGSRRWNLLLEALKNAL